MPDKTKKIAILGLMLAIIFILNALEHMLPPLPLLPPQVKLGLSNIITMYCLFFIGRAQAVGLNALKSFFVFLTRGPMAGLLSLCGGMLSILTIIILIYLFKERISYAAVGIAGACTHNLGQYAMISVIIYSPYLGYYLPVLLTAGVLTGLVTGMLLKIMLPVFERFIKM
jgi:heptaprenyl diphosphate synthase